MELLKRFQLLISVLFCFSGLAVGVSANAESVLIPAPPQVAARSYILIDADSGAVIVEDKADDRYPPASLTKMMTGYIAERELAQGRLKMDTPVLISVNAWRTGGSKMFVREGTEVSVHELLRGIIIQSGNDSSIALAEHIAGSEGAFADVMNQQASLLGMKNSHFLNATGLPADEHYSSARDLAILARAIIRDFPESYPLYSEKYFTYNNIRQPNRNLLLWRDPTVDGLKTGHTEEAGFCLVASAKRDGQRLISVVMGTKSEEARASETQTLLNFGFRYFETVALYTQGQALIDGKVWGGAADQVSMGLADAVVVTVPRGTRDQLEPVVEMDSVIKAPFELGQELGRVRVKLGEQVLVDQPLVALQGVEEGSFFKRIWDAIKLFFSGLFS